MVMLAALLLPALQGGTAAPPCPFDRVVSLEMTADDPVLEGHGPSKRIEYAVEFSGALHVWTKVEDGFETCFRVEDATRFLAERDDSGGKSTPYVKIVVEPGVRLRITVAASKPGAIGKLELHLVAAPETTASRAGAKDADAELAGIRALREAHELESARARIEALVDKLLAIPDGSKSDRVSDALWKCGVESDASSSLHSAERASRATLEHRSRVLPDDHAELQAARQGVAVTIGALGDLRGAQALEEKVLEVRTRTMSADDQDLQSARVNLAVTRMALGDYRGARTLEEQALEVFTRTLPDDHPDLQWLRQTLAATIEALGETQNARSLEEKVLGILSKTLADDDSRLQTARLNLAGTLHDAGDVQGSRALLEKALEVFSRTLPDDHPNLQMARQDLAITILDLGDVQGARALLEKVLEVRSRTLPDEHHDLQATRGTLARAMADLGDLKGCRALEEKVLEVFSRTLPDEHPDLQRARLNLASTLKSLGEFPDALVLERKALDALAKTLPADDPLSMMTQDNLISAEVALGDVASARRRAEDLTRTLHQVVRTAVLTSSPRQASSCVESTGSYVSEVLSMAGGYGLFEPDVALDREAEALIECIRAVDLSSARLLRVSASDPSHSPLREELLAQSVEITRLAQAGAGRDALAAAIAKRDSLQSRLIESMAGSATARAVLADTTIETLSSTLAPDEVLIGYWRYARASRRPGEAKTPDEWVESLLAHVIGAGGRLERVELGPIDRIEQAATEWREAIGTSAGRGVSPASPREGDAERLSAAGERLRRIVFDPLRSAIGKAKRIHIALDDVLHTVPLDALPDGDRLLGNRYDISTILAPRERTEEQVPTAPGGVLLALGGASFSETGLAPASPEDSSLSEHVPVPAGQTSPLLRGSPWERGFGPIPQTGVEARDLAALFHQRLGMDAIVLEGRRASRADLEAFAPRARWLHLATHGWFAPDSVLSRADPRPLDKLPGLARHMSAQEQVEGGSPMVMCGLALAGANLPANDLGRCPGLLTAEEIAALDLANCELAVLSACDTNVGIGHAGQGVASLQRALHMAGARSVITSLWKVPDEVTKDLMLDFYRRIWVDKKPKSRALWDAKMRIRDIQDERGRPKYSTRDWAAWVLTGDPN